MKRMLKSTGVLLAIVVSVAMASAAHAAPATKFTANLFGTGAKGKAVFMEKETSSNGLKRRFKVQVEQALPLQTFEVFVNGSLVGTMTANSGGVAKFEMRSPAPDSPDDGIPMPDDFPSLTTGDTITVGQLSGVFFNKKQGGNAQKFRLEGRTPSSDGFDAKVRYEERFKKSLGLERRFKVEIEDAAPNTSYDIFVNAGFVGTATTDSSGEVEFKLRTPKHANEDWDPMPNTFPSLQPGDVVVVGDASITLELD